MVGARAPGTEQISELALYLTRTKKRKTSFFEGYPVGWGGTRAREGGFMGFGSGGVGGRGTGPRDGANFATCVVFLTFLTRTKRRKKDTLWGGRGYKGSGGGGPGALVPGGRW